MSMALLGYFIFLDVTTEDPPIYFYVITGLTGLWLVYELYKFFKGYQQGGVGAGLTSVSYVG